MTTAADRLVQLSGLSGVSAGTHLLAIGAGLTAAAILLSSSPLPSATAAEHLLADRAVVTEVSAAGSNSGRLTKSGKRLDKYGRIIVRKKPETVTQAARFAVESGFLVSDQEKEQKEAAEAEFKVFIDSLRLQWRIEYVNELWAEYERVREEEESAVMALLLFEQ